MDVRSSDFSSALSYALSCVGKKALVLSVRGSFVTAHVLDSFQSVPWINGLELTGVA